MQELKTIAFTHKSIGIERIGRFHLDDVTEQQQLKALAQQLGFSELMFLSTCNRVELVFACEQPLTPVLVYETLQVLYPTFSEEELFASAEAAQLFEGTDAVRHLFRVASSIDSLVVGEREIITQVRSAFERCQRYGLTGDLIRLAVKHTIETAKQVYTNTHIARKPVSVVSLAHHKLRDFHVPTDARLLIVGAGQTNRNFARLLKKRGYTNFVVFNRTLEKAQALAQEINGIALPLDALPSYTGGFDVLVTCTGASKPIIGTALYQQLLAGDTGRKTVVDLAVPTDVLPCVQARFPMHYIAVESLKATAAQNLSERQQELSHCETIIEERLAEFATAYSHRQVELAMRAIPKQVNAIKEKALNEVFANDLQRLDEQSRAVMQKMLAYVEKKYNAVTMKMAKEILLSSELRAQS